MKPVLGTVMVLSVMMLSSCGTTQYNEIEAISPGAYLPYEKTALGSILSASAGNGVGRFLIPDPEKPIPTVESLQPTLKWKPVPQVEKYDVIIYTAVPLDRTDRILEKPEQKRTGHFAQGKEVYYRESVAGTSHTVEEPLAPDSAYVWSVRTRTGTEVSPWATYNWRKGRFAAGGSGWWWPFQTPRE